MPVSDTSVDAAELRTKLYRNMSGGERVAIAMSMSIAARAITLAGIRSRHPEYDDDQSRWALFRLLVGDEVFRRVWPAAPVLAP